MAVSLAALTPQVAAAQSSSNNIDRAAAAIDAEDYRTAVALLEVEQRSQPEDAFPLRLLGTAYARTGEYEKAIAALQQARSIAPADQDIALMLARSYLWSGRHIEADVIALEIANADAGNTELPQLRDAIAQAAADKQMPPSKLIANVTQSLSNVTIGGESNRWHQLIVGLSAPIAAGATMAGSIDRESRTGPVDTRLDWRADMGFGDRKSAYVAVSTTPNADFREKWGVRAGGDIGLNKAFNITVDLRYADYGLTEIVAFEPGFRLHSADGHLSLAVKSINLWSDDGRHRSGWSARSEVQTHKSVRLAAGGATYPDTEAGITRRTRAAFVGAVVDLSDRMTLRMFYEYEQRAQSYTRNGVVLALSVRF